jgi:flagellar biosynthesis/type III secretory pathway protein FliH
MIVDGIPEPPPEPPEVTISLAEHEAACDAAYRKGFQEANDALAKQIIDQRVEVAQLQDSLFQSIGKQAETLTNQVSEIVPDLAIEIVCRVLAGMKPDKEVVKGIVAETLAEIAPGSTDVEILLSPMDLALVEGLASEFDQKYPGIKLTADPELYPGDCRAKSRFGTIDARIFTKLQNVARSLK